MVLRNLILKVLLSDKTIPLIGIFAILNCLTAIILAAIWNG